MLILKKCQLPLESSLPMKLESTCRSKLVKALSRLRVTQRCCKPATSIEQSLKELNCSYKILQL